MAYQKKPLKVKIEKYEKGEGSAPKTLTPKPLIDGLYLHLETSEKEADLTLKGIQVLGGKKGWIIGSLSPSVVGNLFDFNIISESKPQPEKEKEYLKEWQEKGCLFLLDPTGNATLEAISQVYENLFALVDTMVCKGKLEEAEVKLLREYRDLQIEEKEFDPNNWENFEAYCTLFGQSCYYPSIYLNEEEFKPKKKGFPSITPPPYDLLPENEEEGSLVPQVLIHEPKSLPEKGKKGGGYSLRGTTVNGYMSVEERLKGVLSMLEGEYSSDFEKVYSHLCATPDKVLFALTLTGLNGRLLTPTPTVDSSNGMVSPTIQKDELLEEFRELRCSSELLKEFNVPATEKADELFKVEKALDHPEIQYDIEYLGLLLRVLALEVDGKKFPDTVVKRKIKGLGFDEPIAKMTKANLSALLAALAF